MEKGTLVQKKEKPVIIKTKNNIATWKVNAYSGNIKDKTLTFLGIGQIDCFTEDEAGLEKQRKALDLDNLKDINRQRKTDVRNNVASGTSATAGLKALQKDDPETFADLLELGKQIKAGKVNPALMAKLQKKADSVK